MKPDRKETLLALVVDDDAVNRLLACAALESAGWNVEEAENGREGLEAFQRLQPDVVLLDVMMPEMDGYTTCASLRKLPEGTHTPVLIMTGLDDYNSVTQAYDAGATDFLTKPLNGLLLTHRVRYIVRSSRIVQELRDSQASLVQARDAALESTRLKSEFLATVSHEIRTPMNGVLGMTEWLMETQLTPEQRDCAEAIRTSGDTLLSIISNILDFSKIESGKLQLQQIDFDVKKLLEDIVSPFRQRAQLKGVALACQIQEQVPLWLHGDPDRLCQIVSNLLGNAIKFTEHGEIVLRAEVDERQDPIDPDRPVASRPVNGNTRRLVTVRFSVADTGIGIAPEACTRIFQPFMQADGSTTKKYGGTGLGLAICQQLVDLMGGSIGVDSEPGQGSVFHVTVPLEHKAE
ncbi:MAG: ATP-binding protein [Nitrospirae bacterium]|nr:ATP-binding protein [Nitrospirota bacterium]